MHCKHNRKTDHFEVDLVYRASSRGTEVFEVGGRIEVHDPRKIHAIYQEEHASYHEPEADPHRHDQLENSVAHVTAGVGCRGWSSGSGEV